MPEGSLMDSAGIDDADTLLPDADDLTEASLLSGIQADPNALEPHPGPDADSTEETGDSDKSRKRVADAQRALHAEIAAKAKLEGENAVLREQLKALAQVRLDEGQAPTAKEEALFAWANDESLSESFEQDPGATFQKTMKSLAQDLLTMDGRSKKYMETMVRSVDPMQAKVETAYETLSQQAWFHKLSPEAQRGAAIAHVEGQQDNGSSSSNGKRQPAPPGSSPGGKRVATVTKEVPMAKDPRYAAILTAMGGLRSESESTSLNTVPRTRD